MVDVAAWGAPGRTVDAAAPAAAIPAPVKKLRRPMFTIARHRVMATSLCDRWNRCFGYPRFLDFLK
jgi:hypothetical protein